MLTEKLNFILALCAIFISAASFYATYLQANSAERQVKAMTLPLIQFSHGNYDPEENSRAIDLELKNAGVGPAIIKRVQIKYLNKTYDSLNQFFEACCKAEIVLDKAQKALDQQLEMDEGMGDWVSQPLDNIILPGQSRYKFQSILYGTKTAAFWDKLNSERWNMSLDICYCSMLDECYVTEKNGVVKEIKTCMQ